MAIASKRWFLIFVAALVAFAETGLGQSSVHWSFFKSADGLPEPAYDSISFTPQGKLIAANFNAPLVSELDGYSVSNFPAPPGFIGRICESPGGQRWALSSNGLLEYKNGAWLRHEIPEISAQFHSGPAQRQAAIPFLPVRQGCVIFLLPEYLMEFSTEDPDHPHTVVLRTAAQTSLEKFAGMAISGDGTLWISGARGLSKAKTQVRNLSPKTQWQEFIPPKTSQMQNFVKPEPGDNGGITAVADGVADHQKIVATFDGSKWAGRPAGPENFSYAWRGPDKALWAATAESLFQWDEARTNWVESDEISVGRIFDVELEPGGAFWLATSDGLIRGSATVWQKPEETCAVNSPVQCVTGDSEGRLYFVADNKLSILENKSSREFSLPTSIHSHQTIRALFPLKDGSLIIDVGNALFQFQPADDSFAALPARDDAPQTRALGMLPDGGVCLYSHGSNTYFDDFNGTPIHPLSGAPSINDPDAGLTTLFVTRSGDFWIGGEHQVFWRHNDYWRQFASNDHSSPEGVVGFAEIPGGKIWCATLNELWEFDRDGWLLLRNNFNHINSLLQSRDGSIWIASNAGLFRFYQGVWLKCGVEEDFPKGPVYALCEDEHGQIWAGTAHGLSVFHPEADPGPPKTYIRRFPAEGDLLSEGGTLNLLLEGQDKWKFVSPSRLLYSYQLDQNSWSAFRDLSVLSFPGLAAGRHYFQVHAMDPAGNLESVPVKLDFTVTVPWFRELRLWVVLVFGLGVAIFFAALALNRHRQLLLSHAAVERKVAERTRELEMATRELLHSQKMNALGTLAAGIAHDFNNILSIIKGSAQIIEDNTDQPDKIRTRVDRIKTVVQQGAEIVDAMLGFSRGSDALPAACDANAVITDTIKLLGDRFLREVQVELQCGEKLPEVFAPREFIQQILLNFIFNASEAMSGQKRITLSTNVADKLPPDIVLAPAASHFFVLISVRDCGSGISPEIMPRIFEPFFTTKALSARRGTGLGLSMVYELAKKMNAGLAVQSILGQGSMFTLILPVSKPSDPKAAREVSRE